MNIAYKKFAKHLDKIPNGYPETESGVELKILAKLFSIQEAEIACELSVEPKPINVIENKPDISDKELTRLLIGMVKKGLIEMKRENSEFVFYLIPFVVGFYEHQNAKIDKEFATLFEQYYKEAFYKAMTISPSVHRIIPVEKSIPVNIDVMPYERASHYIEGAQSWGVLNCICRVQKKLIGQGCEHTIENCLVFSNKLNAFKKSETIRSISKQEALDILIEADKEGLVHSTNNVQKEVTYICNCCTCSCGVLRGIVEHKNANAVAASGFYAFVDKELCTGCAACIERCMFNAMEIKNDVCEVSILQCLGCGLCVSTCPADAIELKAKDKNFENPPITEAEWREKRIEAREKQSYMRQKCKK